MYRKSLAWRSLSWLLTAILAIFAVKQAYDLWQQQQQAKARIEATGGTEARRAAASIDEILKGLAPSADRIAEGLASGELQPFELMDRLYHDLELVPDAFRLGVTFAPYALDPSVDLYAPYAVREAAGMRNYQMEATLHYSEEVWYQSCLEGGGWQEPHLSKTTHQRVLGYCAPFHLPGSKREEYDGQVRIDLSMNGIREIVSNLSLGRTGYGFLNSPGGVYLAHPRENLVSEERKLADDREEWDDAARRALVELAHSQTGGHLETMSKLAELPVMVFVEPIPASNWSLGAALFESELAESSVILRRHIIQLQCTLMLLFIFAGLTLFDVASGKEAALWKYMVYFALVVAAGIGMLWYWTLVFPDTPEDDAVQIADQRGLDRFLKPRAFVTHEFKQVERVRIPTGLHLETLRFGGSNSVEITGHVWQKYDVALEPPVGRGFTFPDATASKIEEMFTRRLGDIDVVQYHFEATLRQKFETNHKFPFDQSIVRIRMWPADFESGELLTPDLDAYPLLYPATKPGIDKDLLIPGWTQKASFFGFVERSYTTGFGTADNATVAKSPELSFQFVLSRNFLDPFISTMLPVFVVASLLYTLLFAATKIQEKVAATGFKATDILRAAATLLFPMIYAQINLRSRITASGLLYLEYFYFIMYTAILLVAVNSLAFALGTQGVLHYRDNVIPKLIYWPFVVVSFFLISLFFLY